MKATIETGFRKGKKLMNRSPLRALLCCALLLEASTGCGDPVIGSVINDGGADLIDYDVGACALVNGASGIIVGISAFKEDTNTTNITFGADTINDIQPLPPDTQPIPNAEVYVFGNANVTIYSLDGANPVVVLPATSGAPAPHFSTGDDGQVAAIISNTAATLVAGGTGEFSATFFPAVGGSPYKAGVNVTCP